METALSEAIRNSRPYKKEDIGKTVRVSWTSKPGKIVSVITVCSKPLWTLVKVDVEGFGLTINSQENVNLLKGERDEQDDL